VAATIEGSAEALVPTALGLLVALPAWWGYRHSSNRAEAFDIEMENASVELLNCLTVQLG
jgi:biopolymer transport protein ExbB/TolQ